MDLFYSNKCFGYTYLCIQLFLIHAKIKSMPSMLYTQNNVQIATNTFLFVSRNYAFFEKRPKYLDSCRMLRTTAKYNNSQNITMTKCIFRRNVHIYHVNS